MITTGIVFHPRFGGPDLMVEEDGRVHVDGLGYITRAWNKNIDKWKTLITKGANDWGVPEAWIAGCMLQESGGQQKALSSAGCVGLMQICDPIVPISKQDLWKPENNIDLGARQLAANAKIANWNPVHVFAMYNAGGVYPFSGSASSCTHDGLWHVRENCGYAEQVVRGINAAIGAGYSGIGASGSGSSSTAKNFIIGAAIVSVPIIATVIALRSRGA